MGVKDLKRIVTGLGELLDGVEKTATALGKLRPTRTHGQIIDVQSVDVPPVTREPDALVRDGGMTVRHYDVKNIDERCAFIAGMIQKGRDHPRIREMSVRAVSDRCGKRWCVEEGDYDGEVVAVWDMLRPRYRYVRDTYGKDLFQHPVRTLQFGGGDCFPEGTLVLTSDHELVSIQDVAVGQKIWGYDRWSEVTAKVYRGDRPMWSIEMNNGSTVLLTENHKVTIARCDRHIRQVTPCSCPVGERELERLPVSQLSEGDVVLQPKSIDYGLGEMDPDRAWVEGLYLADGSSGHNTRFDIAGQDGCAKEEQKLQVQAICQRLGIPTNWHRKYISIKDKDWALRVHQMGRRSTEKHALSLHLEKQAADRLLEGIFADSSRNTQGTGRTLTTTSKMLAIQARVLLRMQGRSAGWSHIVDHGGLGKNPIWRVCSRSVNPARAEKLLRVRKISRLDGIEMPCWDLTTDDHHVYLPEADVTVSQCDDAVVLLGSCLQSIGYPIRLRVIRTKGHDDWNHIYLLVGLPPHNPNRWVPLDMSVTEATPGWEAPRAKILDVRDFDVAAV